MGNGNGALAQMASSGTRRAVFLDRDGVLIRTHVRNGKPYAVALGDAIEILDGVAEACSALHKLG